MKRIPILALLGILAVTAVVWAWPSMPYTTYDNLLVRQWFSVGTPSNNVYTNPVFSPNTTAYLRIAGDGTGTGGVTPNNNGRVTPNKTFNVLYPSTAAITNVVASTLNYIAPQSAVNGDILILQGPPTLSVVIRGGTVSTQNLRLAGNLTLTNNFQTLSLVYSNGFWVELFRSLNQ